MSEADPPKKEALIAYLPPELRSAVERAADGEMVSVSAYTRRALAQAVAATRGGGMSNADPLVRG